MGTKWRRRGATVGGVAAAFLGGSVLVTQVGFASPVGGAGPAAARRLLTVAPVLGTPAQLLSAARTAHAAPGFAPLQATGLLGAATRPPAAGGLAAVANSQVRFRGLSGGAALATAKATFGARMFAPAFNAMAPVPGEQRVRGLGMMAELVRDDATGRQTELQSPFPLEVPGPSGTGTRPVDLSITPVAGGFAPRAPIVPVTIANTLPGGVTFPQRGFGFHLAMGSAATAVASPSSVFLPNVSGATDTDFDVVPMPNGVESYLHLRSPAAPERFPLAFTLPPGAHLQIAQSAHPIPNDPPTAIEIVSSDGRALGYVYQPSAIDANGASVAAHAAISGNDIVLTVSHRSPGIQYPVLVDPLVIQPGAQGTGTGGGPGDNGNPSWLGWAFSAFATYRANGYGFGEAIDDPAYFPGLYESMPTNNFFNNLDGAIFYYPAPPGTYLSQVAWSGAHSDPVGMSEAVIGIQSQISPYNFTNGVTTPAGNPPTYIPGNPFDFTFSFPLQGLPLCYANCDPTQGAESSAAVLGITALGTSPIYTYGNKATVTANAATVALGDRRPPIITSPQPPNIGWLNDQGQVHRTTAAFHDDGLGLFTLGLRGASNGPQTFQPDPQCGDVYRRRCPNDYATYSFNYVLPEGVSTLAMYAQDVAGNSTDQPPLGGSQPTTQTFTAKIDNTAPTFALSGTLAGPDGQQLTQSSYTLQINATDQQEPTIVTSGVASIEVDLDGVAQTGACPPQNNPADSAPLTCTYGFNAGTTPAGSHMLTVLATDRAGNQSNESFDVVVVHLPTLSLQSLLSSAANLLTGGANSGARTGQSVADIGDPYQAGADEYAIGAPGATAQTLRIASGSVYIVSQTQATAPTDLSNPADSLFRIDGPAIGSQCGYAVASVGNIDGSGLPGLAVGCPGNGLGLGLAITPKVYVLFGKDFKPGQPSVIDLASLGTQGFEIDGPTITQLPTLIGGLLNGLLGLPTPQIFGEVLGGENQGSINTSGDLAGTGRTDLVIGSPSEGNGGLGQSGSAYVIYGKADSSTINVTNLGSAGYRIDGAHAGDLLGSSAAIAGDVDGSGTSSIVLGAPGESDNGLTRNGDAYFLFPRAPENGAPAVSTVSLGQLGTTGYQVRGPASNAQLGSSVAGLGDENNDGFGDALIGASDGAYVLYGKSTAAAIDLNSPPSGYGFRIVAPAGSGGPATQLSTTTVSSAGDLQDAGTNSFMVGFPTPASGPPSTYIIYGAPTNTSDVTLNAMGGQQGTQITGPPGSLAGASVSNDDASNANNDGAVLIGAPNAATSAGANAGNVSRFQASQLSAAGSTNSPYDAGPVAEEASGGNHTSGINGGPWRQNVTPYPFRFVDPLGDGKLPQFRYTTLKKHDQTRGRRPLRFGFPSLAPNPEYSGAHRWDFKDSLGDRMGSVSQNTDGSFSAYTANGTFLGKAPTIAANTQVSPLVTLGKSGGSNFAVQGFACTTPSMSRTYALVAFEDNIGVLNGNYTYIGIRGFLSINAFAVSTSAFASEVPAGATIGEPPNCNAHPGEKNANSIAQTSAATFAPHLPAASNTDRYQGRTDVRVYHQAGQCPSVTGNPHAVPADAGCGTAYANYTAPEYGSWLYVEGSTTEVVGGGTVMAILPQPSNYQPLDDIGYLDTNVECGVTPVTQWVFGRFNLNGSSVYGWVPRGPLPGLFSQGPRSNC